MANTSLLQHICQLITYQRILLHHLEVIDLLLCSMMLVLCTYHISPLIETFFTEVWQTPNQLLRAVLSDVKVPEYQVGCKALGLINKMITDPLLHVLESQDISILDMNEKLCHLKSCLEQWSQNAIPVLTGEAVL